MSNNLLKNQKIVASGATDGVQTLATRPNQPSVYGVGGLSASELKKRFDSLAEKIIEKHNALCDALGGKDAPSKIGWKEDDNGALKTLADFFATITSGDLAEILQVPNVEGESSTALTDVLAAIKSDLISIKAMDVVLTNGLGGEFLEQEIYGNLYITGFLSAAEKLLTQLLKCAEIIVESQDSTKKTVITSEKVKTGAIAAFQMLLDGSLTVFDNLGISQSEFYNLLAHALSADNLTVKNDVSIGGNLAVTGDITGKNIAEITRKLDDAVLKNPPGGGTQSINSPLQVAELSTEGDAVLGGNVNAAKNLTVGENLFVRGTTFTVHQQSVIAWDNIIVTNAYTSETGTSDFLQSGLVIDTGNGAYGILYKPGDDAVVIGKGTLTKTTDSEGHITDVSFKYDKDEYGNDEALPLAARSEFGESEDGFVPVWDSKLNAFIPGNFKGQENEAGLIEQFQIEQPTLDEGNEKYSPNYIATVGALKEALANVGSSGGKVKGTQGVVYELDNTSQEYYVSYLSISSDEIEELVFADYIDGIPVTKIKTYAFDGGGFPNLKRIEIPGTIREIEPYAFCSTASSTNSVKIIMHPGVEIIGANAFLTFASSTVYAVIPSTVSYIGKGAFAYPTVEYTRDYAKLIFVNPYHWIGKKIACKNKKYAIEPRFLSSDYALSAVNAVDLTLYDYIYNEFLTEEE